MAMLGRMGGFMGMGIARPRLGPPEPHIVLPGAIAEGATTGRSAGTATLANPPLDIGTLTWSELGTGTGAALFAIDGSTGAVTNTAALDYETATSYTYGIQVTDGVYTYTLLATINVTNVLEGASLSAPILSLAVPSGTFPPALYVVLDDTIPVDATFYLRISDTWDFATGTYTDYSHVITLGEAVANEVDMSAVLGGISTRKYYKAWVVYESSTSPYSNVISHGDTTAPILSGGTTSSIELAPMAVTITSDEAAYFAIEGTDAALLELYGSQPNTSITVRRVANANLDYETKASYAYTITATDPSGNVSTPLSCTHTVTDDLSDNPLFDYTVFTAAYDVSRPSSVFKDIAGTIPATADGDDVCYLADLSGHGFHLIAPTTGEKWTLKVAGAKKWLERASTSSRLQNGSPSFSPDGLVWERFSALRSNTWSDYGVTWGCSTSGSKSGMLSQFGTSPNFAIFDGYTVTAGVGLTVGDDGVVEETHTGGGSYVKIGSTTGGAGYAGSTVCNGLTLGNGPLASPWGSGTPDIRFYGAVLKQGTISNKTDVRNQLASLYT